MPLFGVQKLGSAAFLDAGTLEGNLLQLIEDGRLPGANLVGAVSQSDGEDTGGGIQMFSGPNGRAIRLAGGLQICYFRGTLVDQSGQFSGTARLSGAWTLPVAFASDFYLPFITLPIHSSASFVGCDRLKIISYGPSSSTSVDGVAISVFFTDGVSTSEARIEDMSALAVGRWY